MIYLWRSYEYRVYILAIYFKGEKEMMTAKEIDNLLRKVNLRRNSPDPAAALINSVRGSICCTSSFSEQ